ncbi:MAG: HAD-IA family hydrolase [Clostridia bacterium]|nr:HAD-IA family hydrolase [Clostridia bacterium]
MKPKWIFFDIGSTLVDEAKAYEHRIYDMISGTNITFQEFDKARLDFARQGLDGDSEAIRHFGLNKTPWHSEDEIPYPDAYDTLAVLRERGFRLGIIANQNPGLVNRLEAWGLRQFFDVIVSSAEVGYAKPDKAIFEIALKRAGCKAGEGIMVGDRLDNDMLPAKALGMKTVWMKKGLSRFQPGALGDGIADNQIGSLQELKEIFFAFPDEP